MSAVLSVSRGVEREMRGVRARSELAGAVGALRARGARPRRLWHARGGRTPCVPRQATVQKAGARPGDGQGSKGVVRDTTVGQRGGSSCRFIVEVSRWLRHGYGIHGMAWLSGLGWLGTVQMVGGDQK